MRHAIYFRCSNICRLLAYFCALMLTACGGGGVSTVVERATLKLTANVAGCGNAIVHDSGRLVYLTIASSCTNVKPISVSLTAIFGATQTTKKFNFSNFGDELNVELIPGQSRVMSVHQRGSWRSFANAGSWGWRDGAGLLVKDGQLFLLGGYRAGEGSQNEVWSSDNVHDWTLLNGEAPWTGRHGAAWVVHAGRLFVISGDLNDDAWSSEDGINWRREALHAPFGKRYTPNAISNGQKIILYAGQYWAPYDWCAFQPECMAIGLSDVWESRDGKDWREVNHKAPWAGRGLIHGATYFRGRIYIIGGGLKMGLPGATVAETVAEFSDIWSSDDGDVWRLESNTLGFKPRTHFSVVATPTGCFVSDGSVETQGNFSNDLFFALDCVHFLPIAGTPPLQKRHASSLAYFNGSLVILGGPPYAGPETTAGTEVWQYFPE